MNLPQTHEYPVWAEAYISLVDADVQKILKKQATDFPEFISGLGKKGDYAYAPGKWTIKQLIGHIIDSERVFAYRLTCFARGEIHALPGFEEDEYVANAHFQDRTLHSLAEEFSLLRKANLFLFQSLTEKELNRSGTASERQISVRALLFVIAGHLIHHTQIIKERYL
ncbi:DinB family protein [Pedobacter sp. MC2016-24]|uniref:DinB family protein n=1 Tax=Pedobacter sp. MC2016-24 TaxID=2780090 RepID=UPI001881B382|nr:DinB family protein [Pedobacter sp. MC2016-24]MBE9600626.1 DinB family protein [Pedobacter sp. MC2016-24]